MKLSSLEYILCPQCEADDFTVIPFERSTPSDDVLNGLLVCKNCQRPYPIHNGILILFADSARSRAMDEAFIDRFRESREFFSTARINYPENISEIDRVREFWDDHICMGVWPDEQKQFVETRQHRFTIYPWLKGFHTFGHYSQAKVLEIGCGQGIDLCEHAIHAEDQFLGIGTDLSFNSLGVAKRRSEYFHVAEKLDFIAVNALHLPFKKGVFDLTYAYGSLHHSPGTMDALQRACDSIKRSGDFKFMVYAVGSLNHLVHILLRALESTVNISQLIRQFSISKGMGSMTSFKNTGKSAIIHAPYANHYLGITMKKMFEGMFARAEIRRRTILPIAKLSLALQKVPLYSVAERALGYLLNCAFFTKKT